VTAIRGLQSWEPWAQDAFFGRKDSEEVKKDPTPDCPRRGAQFFEKGKKILQKRGIIGSKSKKSKRTGAANQAGGEGQGTKKGKFRMGGEKNCSL